MIDSKQSEEARIKMLADRIREGTDRSYEEWKKGVKRPSAECIAEYLIRECDVRIGGHQT